MQLDASFTITGQIAMDSLITFTNTSKNADHYIWETSDSAKSFDKNFQHRFRHPGNYSIKLTAISGSRTSVTGKLLLIIVPVPVPLPVTHFVIVSNSVNTYSPTGMVGETIRFTNESVGDATSLWQFGDGSPTSNLRTPTHIYNTPGIYTVKLCGTNATGTSCDSATIRILPYCPFNQLTGNYILSGYSKAEEIHSGAGSTNNTTTLYNNIYTNEVMAFSRCGATNTVQLGTISSCSLNIDYTSSNGSSYLFSRGNQPPDARIEIKGDSLFYSFYSVQVSGTFSNNQIKTTTVVLKGAKQ